MKHVACQKKQDNAIYYDYVYLIILQKSWIKQGLGLE